MLSELRREEVGKEGGGVLEYHRFSSVSSGTGSQFTANDIDGLILVNLDTTVTSLLVFDSVDVTLPLRCAISGCV